MRLLAIRQRVASRRADRGHCDVPQVDLEAVLARPPGLYTQEKDVSYETSFRRARR